MTLDGKQESLRQAYMTDLGLTDDPNSPWTMHELEKRHTLRGFSVSRAPSFGSPLGGYKSTAGSAASSIIPTNGQIRLVPFWLPRTALIDRIGCEIAAVGTAGSLARLGIYTSDDQGLPSTLVGDYGQINATTLGFKELAINQELVEGLYWFTAVPQGAPTTDPTFRALSGTDTHLFTATSQASVFNVGATCYVNNVTATGVLPDTIVTSPGGFIGPALFVRFA